MAKRDQRNGSILFSLDRNTICEFSSKETRLKDTGVHQQSFELSGSLRFTSRFPLNTFSYKKIKIYQSLSINLFTAFGVNFEIELYLVTHEKYFLLHEHLNIYKVCLDNYLYTHM